MVLLLCVLFSPLPGIAGSEIFLWGTGATFPYPLYQKWIEIYQSRSDVRITYTPSGSGSGIKQLFERHVDFGGTDVFLSAEEAAKFQEQVLHVPTCVGAVAVIYHLPDEPALKLTPDLIADIFSGEISQWSDQRIARVNPGTSLPKLRITAVHRSEASGTTHIFTDYLSKTSSRWQEKIGFGKTVDWPTGLGVESNMGVAEYVAKIKGSIGYVELTYAEKYKLSMASVQNRSGHFIKPTLDSVAAASKGELPAEAKLLISDPPSADAYPISAFTYIIFYREQAGRELSAKRAQALGRFLWWITHEGQQYCGELLYAPLSREAVSRAEQAIGAMTYAGESLALW
jgi:phosphate transport system substrate-binding protein